MEFTHLFSRTRSILHTRLLGSCSLFLQYASSVPPNDGFMVKKLREVGCIIHAKVNLHERVGGGVSRATDPAILKLTRDGIVPFALTFDTVVF